MRAVQVRNVDNWGSVFMPAAQLTPQASAIRGASSGRCPLVDNVPGKYLYVKAAAFSKAGWEGERAWSIGVPALRIWERIRREASWVRNDKGGPAGIKGSVGQQAN